MRVRAIDASYEQRTGGDDGCDVSCWRCDKVHKGRELFPEEALIVTSIDVKNEE